MRRIHDVRRGFEYLFPKAAADCVTIGGYALERTPFMGEGAVRRKPNRAPFLEGFVNLTGPESCYVFTEHGGIKNVENDKMKLAVKETKWTG